MADIGIAHLWAPRILSILRIVAGLLFLQHGSQKLLSFPPPQQPFPSPLPPILLTAGILELLGGLLILLGWFTRPVAFILSGQMAVAYFMAHAPAGLYPVLNQGELAVLYCFIFLYLFAAGGGEWSLDNIFRKRQRPPATA